MNEITVNEIHALLQPIWKDKTETASRLRGRIERSKLRNRQRDAVATKSSVLAR